LPAAQEIAAAPKQLFSMHYGLIAAVLLCVGIAIGWLHPWQAEQSGHAVEPIVARPAILVPNQIAPKPLFEPPETGRRSEQKLSAPDSTPAVQVAPRFDPMKPDTSASVSPGMASAVVSVPPPAPKKHVSPTDAVQEQKAIPLAELPVTIRQEIPAMTIQLHSYSSNPMNSLVSINSRMMKEGESLMPGLRLEQITPDGVIFSYKGYRFQHGIW